MSEMNTPEQSTEQDSLSEFKKRSPDFLLAEFNTLHSEIIERLKLQYQLVLANVVSLGVFLTIGSQTDQYQTILAYPVIALFVYLEWIRLGIEIDKEGDYIENSIEKHFSPPIGWEHLRLTSKNGTRISKVFFKTPPLVFLVSVWAALGAALILENQAMKKGTSLFFIILLVEFFISSFTIVCGYILYQRLIRPDSSDVKDFYEEQKRLFDEELKRLEEQKQLKER